jgi:hypothetical protein
MDLKEIGWKGMDWMNLAEERKQLLGSSEHSNKHLMWRIS